MGKTIKNWYEGNLYHYTKFKNFEEIIKTKTLILTPCNHAKNDELETYALKKILNKTNLCSKKIEKLLSFRNNSYILCFSKHNNNKHLWSRYADNSNGVVIEVNIPKTFPAVGKGYTYIKNDGNTQDRETGFNFVSMIYDDNTFVKKINKMCENNSELIDFVFLINSYKTSEKQSHLEEEFRFIYYHKNNTPDYCRHLQQYHGQNSNPTNKLSD